MIGFPPWIPGAPWMALALRSGAHGNGGTRAPAPPTPPGPGRGKRRPNINRVPDPTDSRRLSRTTEQLHSFVNSLIRRGELVQTGPATWSLRSGGFVEARDPGLTDDITAGTVVGATWVNSATRDVFVNADNAQNAAVWKKVS